MTLHCAKGLEFPFVFIVGMEEGLLPHYRRGDEIEDLEEERRLCYVGITRAKQRVFLSRAEKRSTFGVGRANLPSRFLEELPMELIQFEESKGKMEPLFSQELPIVDQGAGWPPHMSWDHHFQQAEKRGEDVTQEHVFSGRQEMVLSPVDETRPWEEFSPLRVGMKVRHPKFGEGRVRSLEGTDKDQKATIIFQTAGSKRLKVRYAQLEILE
jgi:DNA helicase-2/ATP-dependent DNA helicase PcrA